MAQIKIISAELFYAARKYGIEEIHAGNVSSDIVIMPSGDSVEGIRLSDILIDVFRTLDVLDDRIDWR